MPEWKFKITHSGYEYYLTFRASDKLSAYAKMNYIKSKFEGVEYEIVYDEPLLDDDDDLGSPWRRHILNDE